MSFRCAWQDWTNVVLGVWLVTSPIALGYSTAPGLVAWNAFLSGIVITATGLSGASRPRDWNVWTNLLLGSWLVASAPLFARIPAAAWNHALLGLLIGGAAFVQARGHAPAR
jgi:hypothetical protein